MATHSAVNPEIKQLYIDGYFCYAYKIGIVTNGLGIIRHIDLYYQNFFKSHPLINPKTLLGDATFDSALLYRNLLLGNTFGMDRHFQKAYIPLNSSEHLENTEYTINENGVPCCPKDASLAMKSEGCCTHKNGLVRFKFVCPKVKRIYDTETHKQHRECQCEHPCTDSCCGRMVYIYPEKNFRAYPGVLRGTSEWDKTHKIRTYVERFINHIKDSFCLAGRKTQNEKTLHADLILSGITQLVGVILANKIQKYDCIRSLKQLIA